MVNFVEFEIQFGVNLVIIRIKLILIFFVEIKSKRLNFVNSAVNQQSVQQSLIINEINNIIHWPLKF